MFRWHTDIGVGRMRLCMRSAESHLRLNYSKQITAGGADVSDDGGADIAGRVRHFAGGGDDTRRRCALTAHPLDTHLCTHHTHTQYGNDSAQIRSDLAQKSLRRSRRKEFAKLAIQCQWRAPFCCANGRVLND